MAVWSWGRRCKLASSSKHKPDRRLVLLRRGQEPHDQEIDPKAVQRAQCFALGRARRDEDPTGAGFRPLVALHVLSPACSLVGSIRRLSATSPSEARTPLRCCCAPLAIMASISVPRTRWSISAGFESHATNCFRRRPFGEEMGENLLRCFGEKLALLVAGRLVKRGCNRLRLSLAPQLFRWPPIGAAVVERVQYNVATRLAHRSVE